MERDRWNYLAIQAYKRGLLSFQRSTKEDERWRLKEEILLGEVERDLSVELHKILHEAESSAAQYVSQKVFKHHYDRAEEQYNILRDLLRPYLGKRVDTDDMRELIDAWEAEFGSLDDPEVQAEIDRFVKQVDSEMKELQDAREGPVRRERPKNITRWC